MLEYYLIDSQKKVITANETHFNWLVIDASDTEEIAMVTQKFDLPDDIFIGVSYPEEVSRVEKIAGTHLDNPISLVLLNLSSKKDRMEKRLSPISIVMSEGLLITCCDPQTHFINHLLKNHKTHIDSFEKVIAYIALDIYTHFVKELREMKQRIDSLDKEARKTTENEELYKQADLEREIVYIDHTLRDQKETMDDLWEVDEFINRLADEQLIYDVRLRQRQTEKMILIYRDLLESIGDLFNGMMENNLNHLMKYLDSAALIISIPAVIAGIWGMNTGGLPGKSSGLGFLLVVIGSVIAAATVGYHLFRKDYTK
ncbi:hypothetical protein A5844_000116 [Enterococcus sp. 10A9_DIV0425]|uniref:Mg2+ cation transporter n=1 Tax=Candidatus Enterococcus wittei TaxID=1987383 RepID=A0A2C9XNX4_9ENTE|nr:magnesium transporter CorA family protein [Enterococcus sp. 10A9_DIV0425]OTP11902.1 hypothetical protein A5844_000116 [Enterococcus sp. 10A9_DIV0425]